MSAILAVTSPSYFTLANSPTLKLTHFNFNLVNSPSIVGHPVKEIRVSTEPNKVLPIPIQISKRNQDGTKSPKSFKSTLNSPITSPRSTRTNLFSPRSTRLIDSARMEILKSQTSEKSPRQDISDLLKNSLKVQSKKAKDLKKKNQNEIKTKITKKMQMKVFDKVTREENLWKFKQRAHSPRPKWGFDDKKVILDTKALREVEKFKKTRESKKKSISFEMFNKKKKVLKNKLGNKINLKLESPEENFSKQKADIYKQILDLDDRVNKCKNLAIDSISQSSTEEKANAAVKIQAHVRGFLIRRAIKKYLDSSSHSSSLAKSEKKFSVYNNEDEEVKGIMRAKIKIEPISSEQSKQELNKSYERMLASQIKIKIRQQQQLTELRAKDLNEMNKLAEVLGGNEEMKEKFQFMIDRRYSKLVNFFEENIDNIKQALGYGEISDTNLVKMDENSDVNKTPVEEFYPSLRNTISEFSSSFLDQLKGVPNNLPADLTFDPVGDELKNDFIDSPEEQSVYSRDTYTEPSEENVLFPIHQKPGFFVISQEEPNIPLISDSFSENPQSLPQEKSEERALMSLVEEIKEEGKVEDTENSDTLNLTDEKVDFKQTSPILIYEESFSSNESGVMAEYSSIMASPVAESNHEFPSAELSKAKPHRSIVENFPYKEISPFTAAFESSTEHDGFELIINRVVLTLEIYIFSMFYQEILGDEEFISNILQAKLEKRSKIPIKGLDSMLSSENQVQTDQIAVFSFIKKLQALKTPENIQLKLCEIYNPLLMLSRIQENFEESQEDFQIFDSVDLGTAEKSNVSSDPFGISSSELQIYVQIHNKMIVDVLNEALLRSAKHKFPMPWSFDRTIAEKVNTGGIVRNSIKKILKWSEIEAGKVPSTDMITSTGELDEDRLQVVREDKLAEFLIMDVDEGDKSWISCEFEEGQVSIDVSDWILSELYMEIVDILI